MVFKFNILFKLHLQKYAKIFQFFKIFYFKLLHVFPNSVENTGVRDEFPNIFFVTKFGKL